MVDNPLYLILLDFSKFFGSIDSSALYAKLRYYFDFDTMSVWLLRAYHSDSMSLINVSDVRLYLVIVHNGVPQCSIHLILFFFSYILTVSPRSQEFSSLIMFKFIGLSICAMCASATCYRNSDLFVNQNCCAMNMAFWLILINVKLPWYRSFG